MKLVIVESPTKERTISKFLDKNFVIKSSYGHVRDLPSKELGVDINKDFQPSYVVLPKAKEMLTSLKKCSDKADEIYLATDYDREGESIAWHLTELLKLPKNKTKRITFHEITKPALLDALKNPRELDTKLVDAQQSRRILDRLVGYKISPLLWRKVRRGLSAGRVQSVALKLIAQRENEINNFVAQEYWTIKAELDTINKEKFMASLSEYAGKKLEKLDITNKDNAELIVQNLKPAQYKVIKVERKDKKRQPYPPFITSTLQQEASRRLGLYVKKVMQIAQQLYEGIELGKEETVGLITYHRTDSVQVSTIAQKEALDFIHQEIGEEYAPEKPRKYITKTKGAQEAHEAIRPTSVLRKPEIVKKYLTRDQFVVYDLIWKRFVASQMTDAILDTVSVDILAENQQPEKNDSGVFRATGQTIKFYGFLKIYATDDEEKEKDENSKLLPVLNEQDKLGLINLLPEQHFTEPPPRYNEASLIKILEKNGIGRPSTYAPIVSTLIDRGYCTVKEKRYYLSELGKIVNDLMEQHFKGIVDINFTATMEEDLDKVAQGEMSRSDLLKEFYEPFAKDLENAQNGMQKVQIQPQPTDEICSSCGAPMLLRTGRFGKFLSCSKFPECKNKISLDREGKKKIVQMTDEKCEKCGKPMVIRNNRRGSFLGCSGFPKCRNIKPLPRTTESNDDKSTTPQNQENQSTVEETEPKVNG